MTTVLVALFSVAVLAAILVAIQTATRSRPPEELMLGGALATAGAVWIGAPLAGWGLAAALVLCAIYIAGGLMHLRLMWPDMAWISVTTVVLSAGAALVALVR